MMPGAGMTFSMSEGDGGASVRAALYTRSLLVFSTCEYDARLLVCVCAPAHGRGLARGPTYRTATLAVAVPRFPLSPDRLSHTSNGGDGLSHRRGAAHSSFESS